MQSQGYWGRIFCQQIVQLCGPFSGPAMPDVKDSILLNLNSNKKQALDFITKTYPLEWALFFDAGAGAVSTVERARERRGEELRGVEEREEGVGEERGGRAGRGEEESREE